VSSFCTSVERAASFAILSTNPFLWLILSGQLVWAGQWMTAMAQGFQTSSNHCKICGPLLISLPPHVFVNGPMDMQGGKGITQISVNVGHLSIC
jgi:hypothetical protein